MNEWNTVLFPRPISEQARPNDRIDKPIPDRVTPSSSPPSLPTLVQIQSIRPPAKLRLVSRTRHITPPAPNNSLVIHRTTIRDPGPTPASATVSATQTPHHNHRENIDSLLRKLQPRIPETLALAVRHACFDRHARRVGVGGLVEGAPGGAFGEAAAGDIAPHVVDDGRGDEDTSRGVERRLRRPGRAGHGCCGGFSGAGADGDAAWEFGDQSRRGLFDDGRLGGTYGGVVCDVGDGEGGAFLDGAVWVAGGAGGDGGLLDGGIPAV